MRVHRRLGLPIELLDGATMRRRFPMIDFSRHRGRPLRAALRRADGAARGPDPGRRVRPRRRRSIARKRMRPPRRAARRAARASSPPPAGRYGPNVSSSPAAPGSAGSSRICSAGASSRPGRRCSSSRPRRATRASSRAGCPAGPISTAATSITAFRTSKAAASRSPMTRTAPPMDPDTGDRIPSPQALADVRAFMARRFPRSRRAAAERGARLPI